jgi:3',5'-cyclic AMP phosphodiesterase CpdA
MMIKVNRNLVLLFLLFCISCDVGRPKPFSFVQLCDPQLGMGGYGHDTAAFHQAVRQINELGCDFVVICGDLVHHAGDSSYTDFLRIREEFTMPCYLAPGNHDLGNVPDDSSLLYYRKTIGEDYYTFRNKGVGFIVTNTQLWKSNIGKESENHDRWFKETLLREGRKGEPVIVIGHYPLFLKSPDEEEEYFNLPLEKRKELLQLFLQNNVRAYLSGHTHRTVISQYENILMVCGETTCRNFDNRPLGFRLWEVTSDTLEHRFVPLQQFMDEQQETESGQALASNPGEPERSVADR